MKSKPLGPQADFLRENGVEVGDFLLGDPIVSEGRVIELPVFVRITAIGDELVLARKVTSPAYAGSEGYGREGSWSFADREWRKL